MALRCRRLSLRQGLILILCIPTFCIFLLGRRQQWLEHLQWSGTKCIGWRATSGCIPYGPRQPAFDRTCTQEVRGGSGYCLCEGNTTVARMSCGPHRFRCRDKCAELAYDTSGAQLLPKPLVCGPLDGYDVTRLVPDWGRARRTGMGAQADAFGSSGMHALSNVTTLASGAVPWTVRSDDVSSLSHASSYLWDMVDDLVGRHGPGNAVIPGPRLRNVDWVMEGRRTRDEDVDKMAAAVAGLLKDLPPYPGALSITDAVGVRNGPTIGNKSKLARLLFSGRGVVMVGGGLRYLTPAWTSLHVLRRTGCTLPVELWFPVEEFPTSSVEAALVDIGVTSRRLSARDLAQKGYGVKIAALLLSSFQEVLFLDSDNVLLRDPTYLFESEPYVSTGALLWPDYWDRTTAPEVARILNLTSTDMPAGTFESGQMVIDKARHWRGLLVAVYMNVYGATFSELLSCYIGKGDKETFGYGMMAAGEPMWVSPVKPGSVGVVSVVCTTPGRAAHCLEQYLGNTMVQHGPEGLPLFFHANYHKWDLALPDSFEAGWNRRWQVLQPFRRSVVEAIYNNNHSGSGYDIERFIYDVLRAFRCAPWFDSYHAARVRMGENPLPDLDGFHPLPDYITFRDFYRAGWTGNFDALVYPPLTFGDRLTSWYQRKPRWWMRPIGRKLCRLRKKLLPSFLRCRNMK